MVTPKRLHKPWINSAILRSIKTKAHYFKLFKLGIISAEVNRMYRNKLNNVIRYAMNKYYLEIFSKHKKDIKRTWKVIKTLLNKNSSSMKTKQILVNGETITDCGEIAEGFSNYFAGIADVLEGTIPQAHVSSSNRVPENIVSSLFLNPVTNSEIMQIILSLKNTSGNVDEVPVRLIKQIGYLLAATLTRLINKSFVCGIFPDVLKVAKIIPIYKSSDPQLVSNYRPISILPVFSKIFERCLAQRLLNFMQQFNLISPHQYGFLKGKSTSDAFLKLTEYIYKCLNEKQHCMSIFIDI